MSKRHRAGFPTVKPEHAGLSSAPLQDFRARTEQDVQETGDCVGGAHIILHRGRCVFAHANGWANRKRKERFGLRTLCRLHSNTKALVAAAFFTLLDQGRVRLSDPITKFLRFSEQVQTAPNKPPRCTRIKPTLRHLLTMTSGLKCAESAAYAKIIDRVKRGQISNLAAFCDEIAKVPLQSEPGSQHNDHSLDLDILGRVCEIVSGKSIDKFVKDSLLRPLGMRDTCFVVPEKKRRRVATLYDCQQQVALPLNCPEQRPAFATPGGGLYSYEEAGMWSTTQDFARFCQMLLDGGIAASGKRVLRAATVRLLWRDSLTPYARNNGRVRGWNNFEGRKGLKYWDKRAWSFLHTTLNMKEPPSRNGPPRVGRAMWNYGGGGTAWEIDARRKLVALSFNQSMHGMYVNKNHHTYCMPDAVAAIDDGCLPAKRLRR